MIMTISFGTVLSLILGALVIGLVVGAVVVLFTIGGGFKAKK